MSNLRKNVTRPKYLLKTSEANGQHSLRWSWW